MKLPNEFSDRQSESGSESKRSRRGVFTTLLKAVVTIGAIVYLVMRHGGDLSFWEILRRLSATSFATAVAIYLFAQLLVAARWRLLLRSQGVGFTLRRALQLSLVSQFFNVFLPTTIGGDVVRFYGARAHASGGTVAASILVERVVGLGCLLALGGAASLVASGEIAIARTVLLVVGAVYLLCAAGLMFVPIPSRIPESDLLRRLRNGAISVQRYRTVPGTILGVIGLSLAWQMMAVLTGIVLLKGMAGAASAVKLAVIIPIAQLVAAIPVSLGGHGLREAGYDYFFRVSGLDPAEGFALAVAMLGVSLVLALVGALVYCWAPVRR